MAEISEKSVQEHASLEESQQRMKYLCDICALSSCSFSLEGLLNLAGEVALKRDSLDQELKAAGDL